MIILRARVVDSTHLELSEPIEASEGRSVLVSITESAETDAEREEWLGASELGLQKAYGDSEPDYPASMIKAPNPDYET
jgi:hypothetical protein